MKDKDGVHWKPRPRSTSMNRSKKWRAIASTFALPAICAMGVSSKKLVALGFSYYYSF